MALPRVPCGCKECAATPSPPRTREEYCISKERRRISKERRRTWCSCGDCPECFDAVWSGELDELCYEAPFPHDPCGWCSVDCEEYIGQCTRCRCEECVAGRFTSTSRYGAPPRDARDKAFRFDALRGAYRDNLWEPHVSATACTPTTFLSVLCRLARRRVFVFADPCHEHRAVQALLAFLFLRDGYAHAVTRFTGGTPTLRGVLRTDPVMSTMLKVFDAFREDEKLGACYAAWALVRRAHHSPQLFCNEPRYWNIAYFAPHLHKTMRAHARRMHRAAWRIQRAWRTWAWWRNVGWNPDTSIGAFILARRVARWGADDARRALTL